jgi:hypothetical protein
MPPSLLVAPNCSVNGVRPDNCALAQKKIYEVVEPERVWREYTAFCRQSRSDKSKSGKPCLLLRERVKLVLNVQVTPRERKPVYSRDSVWFNRMYQTPEC